MLVSHRCHSYITKRLELMFTLYPLVKVDEPAAAEIRNTAEVNEVNIPPVRSMMNILFTPMAMD